MGKHGGLIALFQGPVAVVGSLSTTAIIFHFIDGLSRPPILCDPEEKNIKKFAKSNRLMQQQNNFYNCPIEDLA